MIRNFIIAAIVAVILVFVGLSSCTRIDAGHEGILVKQYGSDKGVQDVFLVTGRVWFNPFTESVFEFPVFVQTADYEPFTVNAKDGSVFTVDPTISFFVEAGKSPHIFTKYRKPIEQITQTTLYNYVKDAFRIQMNKYTTNELISYRQKFEEDVQITLGASLLKDGFKLEQLTSGLQYPEAIVMAIDSKNKAVQQAMQVENELKVAEAQARKKMVEAEAEAKANELRIKTLSPMLIQQQFIEKWDGKTPLYGNSPVFFQNVR
jgi:regulator of protease activity HflC (stomatin/prohibitin superfamily)